MKTVKLEVTPSQVFDKYYKIVQTAAGLCGANVFQENYRLTAMTYFVMLCIVLFFSFIGYTMFHDLVIDRDYIKFLQVLCIIGTGIQGTAKLINAILNARKVRLVCSEITAIYKDHEYKEDHYRQHLDDRLTLVKRIMYVLLQIYFILTMALLSVPVFYQLILKNRIEVYHLLIPGVPSDTEWGSILHQLFHMLCACLGSFGNFASDTMCFLIVAHIPLMKNIIKCKFDDLNATLSQYPGERKRSQVLLRDILQWHQKYISFSDNTRSIFFWVIFIQVTTATQGIICAIVCIFLKVWPVAPVFILYSFVILYSYCALGNLVEISDDDLSDIIYDCLWYELSVPEQKMVLFMLQESQNPQGLTVGGISPLSLNTALQLTKTIYTMAMVLNESLD